MPNSADPSSLPEEEDASEKRSPAGRRNHGEYVSYWAREGCSDDADEEAIEEEDSDENSDGDPQPGDEDYEWANHGECVSWHAHQDESAEGNEQESGEAWRNHGQYVSFWAREGCRDESPGDEEADDADEADELDEDDADEADKADKADKQPKANKPEKREKADRKPKH